ncbi:putative triacylglycerol lipase [Dioscorea sansibarensis]
MITWPYLMMCLMLCICGFGQALDQGMYLLGASVTDVGNNNSILHGAKANYFPYGINFTDSKATIRFSDGKNAADFFGISQTSLIPLIH